MRRLRRLCRHVTSGRVVDGAPGVKRVRAVALARRCASSATKQAIPTTGNKASRFWSGIAKSYDGAYFSFFCDEAATDIVERAQLHDVAAQRNGEANMTVLDVGAGTGAVTLRVARTVPEAKVLSTDFSDVMVTKLNRKIAASPKAYAHVQPFVADATDLQDVPSDSVDVVFSNQAVTFMPDKAAAMKELVRVLRPGGSLFVTGWATMSMCPAHDVAYRALEAVQQAKFVRTGKEYVPFRQQPNDNFSLADRQAFADLLEGAGCTDVGVSMGKAHYTRASMSELRGMALQQFAAGIDDDELELFVHTFESLANAVIKEDRFFAMYNVGFGRKL